MKAHAAALASWALRAKASGYFDEVWAGEIEKDGFFLEKRTREAIEAWSGLPHASVTVEEAARSVL